MIIDVPALRITQQSEIYKLNSYISRNIGNELRNMHKTCYTPKLTPYWNDIWKYSGIQDTDIRMYKQSIAKYSSIAIFNEKNTVMLSILLLNFSRMNRQDVASNLFIFLGLKFYSSFVHKYLKFCKDNVWERALELISQKHLFKVKNGISNAILYICTEEFRKNYIKLQNKLITELDLIKIVYALRTRLEQSCLSFFRMYYSIDSGQSKYSSHKNEELDDEAVFNIQRVSDEISRSICTYSTVDKDALNKAISVSGIRRDIAIETIKNISVLEYKQQIEFIIILLNKIQPLNEICISKKKLMLIRKVINDVKVLKYSVKDEIIKIILSLPNMYDLSMLSKSQLVTFFMHYITGYIQARICK